MSNKSRDVKNTKIKTKGNYWTEEQKWRKNHIVWNKNSEKIISEEKEKNKKVIINREVNKELTERQIKY
jgi:hypothetical protein